MVSGCLSFGACSRDVSPRAPSAAAPAVGSFAIYTLSRGKGVPPEVREALKKVEEVFESDRREGVSVTLHRTRIGIEGESRLCAEYGDPHAGARAYARVRAIVHGIELMNLVVEPCKQ